MPVSTSEYSNRCFRALDPEIPEFWKFAALRKGVVLMRTIITLPPVPPALHVDPIKAIEHHQKYCVEIEVRHGATVRGILTFALDFVKHLRQSENDAANFRDHAFWYNKPYKIKLDRLPLLVMQFIYSVAKSGGAKYERARKHSQIVEWYLNKNYTSEEMREDLRLNTLDEIEDQIKVEQKGGGVPDSVDDKRRDSSNDNVEATKLQALDTGRRSGGSMGNDSAAPNRAAVECFDSDYPFNTLREIAINADLSKIEYMRQLPVGAVALVRIKRMPSSDVWAKFEALNISRPRGR